MQERQVDLKLGVGIILPMFPDLLLKRCQYITADITATSPASVPDEPPGNGMSCLQSKEACCIPPSPTASPASGSTGTHEEVPGGLTTPQGPTLFPADPKFLHCRFKSYLKGRFLF